VSDENELEPLDPTKPWDYVHDLSDVKFLLRLLTQHVIALQKRVEELEGGDDYPDPER
jgi:hypothetical protein